MDFDAAKVERVIVSVIDRVLDSEGDRAFEIAREKAPVRKVFKGGRKTTRLLTSKEIRESKETLFRSMTPNEQAKMLFGKIPHEVISRLSVGTSVITHRNKMTLWGKRNGESLTRSNRKNPENEISYTHLRGTQGKYLGTQGMRNLRLVKAFETEGGKNPPPMAGNSGRDMTGKGALFRVSGGEIRSGTGYVTWNGPGGSLGIRNAQILDRKLNKEGRRALKGAKFGMRDGKIDDVGYGALSPNEDGTFDLGGSLRKSVRTEDIITEGRHEKRVIAGSEKVYYAIYMELGTRYVAARPFLRPALASVERTLKNKIHSALSNLAKNNPITE